MSGGWPSVRLEELTTKVGSGITPRGGEATYKNSGTPLIRSMNVIFFGFRQEGLAHLDDSQTAAMQNVEVQTGDVLLNITGASIGRVTIAPPEMHGARVNQHVCIIRPIEGLDPRYLSAFLSSPKMQAEIGSENYGATRQALTKQQILDFEIPLAPINEQKRIGDKLDAILARVNSFRESLQRIPIMLNRFRQAVLSDATSGKLTEEWRLHRGRKATSWERSTIDALIDRIEAGINVQCEERPPRQGERGLVKISAVTWGAYDDNESKTLPSRKLVAESTRIRVGDFLISRANTLELVGACVIAHKVTRAVYLSDKVLRLIMPDALKPWLLYVLRSPDGRRQIEELASGNQLSMRNLSQANLRRISVPLPPADERAEILSRVEALFAYADQLEARCTAARSYVENLVPALLAKAFRGELVPQDPNDEPAAVLLERIRAARAQEPKPRRGRTPRAATIPRAPREKAAMTKSRYDADVKDQAYLAGLLRQSGGAESVEELFRRAELPVTDFYKQLTWEVEKGHIRDDEMTLEAA